MQQSSTNDATLLLIIAEQMRAEQNRIKFSRAEKIEQSIEDRSQQN
jgi:hypothetical protein